MDEPSLPKRSRLQAALMAPITLLWAVGVPLGAGAGLFVWVMVQFRRHENVATWADLPLLVFACAFPFACIAAIAGGWTFYARRRQTLAWAALAAPAAFPAVIAALLWAAFR